MLLWLLLLLLASPLAWARPDAEAAAWERTVDRVSAAVVSIRVTATRPFDTESAGSSVATGFIVDARRGLVLTNRHVVGPGPVKARAVFLNNEEIDLVPVYRDPVHDFGFFRFDPEAVRFMQLSELKLAPEKARVGAEIRVIGNDAGEKISILAGTLARLDLEAPSYGRYRYNDFNTFYYQAASGTSGGSSGSPVVDRDGDVIALNAGSRRNAASSYFLPLERVARALERIRQGQPVPRGTIQATLVHRTYDELRRLGLRAETEAAVRAARPQGTGLLVFDGIVPQGPAWDDLALGDVLRSLDGRPIHDFIELESVLDESVGKEIQVGVERGGTALTFPVLVQDLHEITPSSYVEVGDVLLNELSYQQARHGPVPTGGAYVSASGYMLQSAGVSARAVITAIGDEAIYSLEDAWQALLALPDGARVPLRWYDLAAPRSERTGVMTMDRRWFPMRRCAWEAASSSWPCEEAAAPPPAPPTPPVSTTIPRARKAVERRLAPSLVGVNFRVPYRVEGTYGSSFQGNGLIVDAARGIVLVDRDTVPNAMGDATITFAGSVEVPARLLHVHPLHNLAWLQYDPAAVGQTPVRAARLDDRPLRAGDRVWHVGLDRRASVVSSRTRVDRVEPLALPLPSPPFFRDGNLETIILRDAARAGGGVLADRRGRVQALWASFVDLSGEEPRAFFRGLPGGLFLPSTEALIAGRTPSHRALGCELEELTLVDARRRGLPEEAARALEQAGGLDRRAFMIKRLWADAPAREQVREGDILLEVEGQPAVSLLAIERATEAERVRLRLARLGQVREVEVRTLDRQAMALDHVVSWAGALLHPVHEAVPSQRGLSPTGVYVAWFWYGSPAAQYGLRPTRRILEVDGQPTPDLASFLDAVRGRPLGSVRLKTEDLDGRTELITLEQDPIWWPTWELRRGPEGWSRGEVGNDGND